MRIIAGSRRGTKLTKLDAANTRPTADRVRESLFNILDAGRFRRILDGAVVIDAFAGTGALGLEALSRGAASAILSSRIRPRSGFYGRISKNWICRAAVKSLLATPAACHIGRIRQQLCCSLTRRTTAVPDSWRRRLFSHLAGWRKTL